jgi:hypothetical protein
LTLVLPTIAQAAAATADAQRPYIEADWLRQDSRGPAAQAKQPGPARPASSMNTKLDAAGAVDGVKNGKWGFHTSQDDNPWWQVDLGNAAPLDRVVIYNTSHIPDRASRLKVLLSEDARSWREVYAHNGTPFVGFTDGKPLVVPMKGAAARHVRIQLPGKAWLHLDEVEVYGQADPKRNIAVNRPADQSSASEWSVGAAVAAATGPSVPELSEFPIERLLERGRRLAEQRRQAGVAVDAMTAELDALAARWKSLPKGAEANSLREVYVQIRSVVRRLLLGDPRLTGIDKLLFVRRKTYHSSHIYTDHFDGSGRMGGNLCILSPVAPDGKVTVLAPELEGGIFGRYDLSYGADKVVFAYKKPGKGYRIYEIGVDGKGLRQLTQDGPDEKEMIARYQHGYDDLDPCYLPDGRIMFASTRSKRAVLCHNAFTVTTLYAMDGDGQNMRCVSGNTVNEFAPCTLADGRVIYTRWEYVDKGCGDVQSLWAVRPDGSGAAHVFKNNVSRPATLIDARDIPGSQRLVAVGAPHMPLAVGPLILIDIHITQLTQAAMTNLTPEIGYPGHGDYPGARFGYYKEPFPLGEDLFIVCYNPGPRHDEAAGYGLYAFDAANHRELLYREEEFSCFQPMPLRPRLRPLVVTPQTPVAQTPKDEPAELFMADAYQGLTGIPRGMVKYLRVMEDVPKPWEPSYHSPGRGDSMGLQNPAVSLRGHFTVKKIHGVVPVNEDGSVYVQVPAKKNLYFQVLDENYMELQRMRTFVNLMPGERRGCIGCHEPRNHTPTSRPLVPIALNQPLRQLAPQPGDTGPRMVHYPSDVQPILDKHCLGCHGGAQPKGELDLTGEYTVLFSRSYENLINKRLINNIDVDPRDAFIPAVPPLTFGSHRSKLVDRLRSAPCKTDLGQAEFVKLVTWIDANAPFYGNYEGKKNVKWKGDPDFRPNP